MKDPSFQLRLRATFQLEASEHLRALARDAFALEQAPPAQHPALIERIFRETHTLKGAARMVGELEAESLCQDLEQRLSRIKNSGVPVVSSFVVDLKTRIGEIARALAMPMDDAPPPAGLAIAEPVAPPVVRTASSHHVRVPGARLDMLLRRAEEMLGAKLAGDLRATELRELSQRGFFWKREWDRVRSDVVSLRRHLDQESAVPVRRELDALLQYVDRAHERATATDRELRRLAKVTVTDQRRLGTMVEQLLDETKEVLMQPLATLLESFPGFVSEIASQDGKEIEFRMSGGETEIDRRVIEELRDSLLHLVRNAVDHGIEPAAERERAGKATKGALSISIQERSGGLVEIAVSDDGRGIDPREITASARRLGLIAADSPELSEADTLSLVFASGFSTRLAATSLSGRGLGLAIVREKAEQIGGTVTVESRVGEGTTFRFLLPVTLARFRGVFVTAQRQRFVIPAPYVRRVLRFSSTVVRRVKSQEMVEIEGDPLTLLSLAEILGLPSADRGGETIFAIVIESARVQVALRVDSAPHEQEVVMKSLGPLLRRAQRYVGATLVGAGEIVPVLNVAPLIAAASRQSTSAADSRQMALPPSERRQRTVLVAEDSITSRSLLKNILQNAGFEVRTAVDGADALTTLKFERVDLLISDVQMPRLDGFELTSKIRSDPGLSTLPVILITSLASQEDKARGVDAGANAYIVKSSFDQSDLLEAIRRLLP